MNIICIMLDSLRQDHVSFYNRGRPVFDGVAACQTPNLDAFARQAVVFENAYPEALPTLPVRTQLFTGQRTLPSRSWQPLVPEDIPMAEILHAEDYVCGLISDCYHYRAPSMNYHRGFDAYNWIRGQEYDPWTSHPPNRNVDDFVNEHYDPFWRGRVAHVLANTEGFVREEDWFAAQVVDLSIQWLADNRGHKNIFAWIDSFDPHEPWDPPARFDTYTQPEYRGKRLILPMGGLASSWATPEEVSFIRGLYAGEVAFVDHCLGRLFAALEDLGYYDDSVIVITADHGHPLADHGKFLKGGDRMYSELLKLPFMIRLPGGKDARRTPALIQFQDVLPTLLDVVGVVNDGSAMHGKSFLPVLRGETDRHRSAIITGYHEAVDRCIRDDTWSYIQRPTGERDELYNLKNDPQEKHNLIGNHPGEAERLAGLFGKVYQGRAAAGGRGIQGRYELAASGLA
jgi:arylsulfatase A-like enzyme